MEFFFHFLNGNDTKEVLQTKTFGLSNLAHCTSKPHLYLTSWAEFLYIKQNTIKFDPSSLLVWPRLASLTTYLPVHTIDFGSPTQADP